MFILFSIYYCMVVKFFFILAERVNKYINLKMLTFSPVMLDGRDMVPNNGVYLGNHCIDEFKILQSLVWVKVTNFHQKQGSLESMMVR